MNPLWKAIMDLSRKATSKAWKSLAQEELAAARLLHQTSPKTKLLGYGPGSIGESVYGVVGDKKILAPNIKVLDPEALTRPVRASMWIPDKEVPAYVTDTLKPALQFKGHSLIVDTAYAPATKFEEHTLNSIFKAIK
jgi:hypothetical protein